VRGNADRSLRPQCHFDYITRLQLGFLVGNKMLRPFPTFPNDRHFWFIAVCSQELRPGGIGVFNLFSNGLKFYADISYPHGPVSQLSQKFELTFVFKSL
jgi:hypothetical protein